MPAQKKTKINLLPQKGLEASTSGRVLLWILTTFRVIVIVTELVVMAAFLSRFWLDAKNTDLSEEISHKKEILIASADFEKQFIQVQKRLEILSELTKGDKVVSSAIENVRASLPADIFLNDLVFSGKKVSLTGISPNEKSIQQFIANLEVKDSFETISLGSIDSEKDNSEILKFELSASIK